MLGLQKKAKKQKHDIHIHGKWVLFFATLYFRTRMNANVAFQLNKCQPSCFSNPAGRAMLGAARQGDKEPLQAGPLQRKMLNSNGSQSVNSSICP